MDTNTNTIACPVAGCAFRAVYNLSNRDGQRESVNLLHQHLVDDHAGAVSILDRFDW